MSQQEIAVVGLGAMGSGLAARLLDLGYTVSVYNRTQAAAETFVARGARSAARPCDAVTAGGIAITSVANDEALEAGELPPGGALPGPRPGGGDLSKGQGRAGG